MVYFRYAFASAVSLLALSGGGASHAQVPMASSAPPPDVAPTPADGSNDGAGPANGSNTSLSEIVVTAQKRSENVQKIPIAITTASAEKLTNAGVVTVLDLSAAIPGLKLLNIGGQVSARIRGIGSTSINPGTESPVAVFIDNVYYASSSDVGGDLADISQVAVLKGPQGTLFGRNATGGVIQISTRNPTDQLQIDLATGLDNYRTWRSDVYIGGPVGNGIKAGLSAQYATQGKGWGTNFFNGEDVHKIDGNLTLRGKIIIDVGPNTTVNLSADYSHRKDSNAGAYTVFPGFVQAYDSPIPKRLWDINSYIQPLHRYSGGGGSVTIDQDLGFAKLTSITAYRRSTQFWRFNPAVTAVPSLNLDISDFSRQLTEEVQLVSQGSSRLSWAIGAFYFHNYAGQDPLNIYIQAGPYRGSGPFSQVVDRTNQKLNSVAGFGQATYRITDHTRFTAGIRYTWEKKTLHGFQYGILANGAGNVTFVPENVQSDIEQKPTWRVSLDQDLAPQITGYISYNRGFKSGGFNTRDSTNPPFKPEILDAYEVGVKSQILDNRIRLNAAGFYYDYSNVQVARYTTNTVIYNGARAHIYGLDLDFDARLTDEFSLNGGLSYLHSRFVKFPNAVSTCDPANPPGALCYTPVPGGNIIKLYTINAKGNVLPYSPALSFNISADYKMSTPIGPVTFDVTDSYTSHFYAESDNVLRQKAAHLLNTSLTWESANGHFGASLFMNNILNKAIASQFGSLVTGYEADYPQPPRTYGFRLRYSY